MIEGAVDNLDVLTAQIEKTASELNVEVQKAIRESAAGDSSVFADLSAAVEQTPPIEGEVSDTFFDFHAFRDLAGLVHAIVGLAGFGRIGGVEKDNHDHVLKTWAGEWSRSGFFMAFPKTMNNWSTAGTQHDVLSCVVREVLMGLPPSETFSKDSCKEAQAAMDHFLKYQRELSEKLEQSIKGNAAIMELVPEPATTDEYVSWEDYLKHPILQAYADRVEESANFANMVQVGFFLLLRSSIMELGRSLKERWILI